jgi:hypothetical protein
VSAALNSYALNTCRLKRVENRIEEPLTKIHFVKSTEDLGGGMSTITITRRFIAQLYKITQLKGHSHEKVFELITLYDSLGPN